MKESSYLDGQEHLVQEIKDLPIFKPFSEEKIKNLLRLSKIRQYETNEFIIKEGGEENCLYLLISGCVQVEKHGEVIEKLRRSGDIFGELGFIDHEPRSATVRSLSNTACLVLDASQLENINEAGYDSFHAMVYKMFAQILAFRLRVTTAMYLETKEQLDRIKSPK